MRPEIVFRAGDDEMLGMGIAVESDAEFLAHRRAAAVCGDQPLACKLGRSVGPLAGYGHAVVGLRQPRDPVAEDDLRTIDLVEPAVEIIDELELLALKPVGVVRILFEHRQVEFGDAPLLPVAELPGRAFQAALDEGLGDPRPLQQVERRRMERRCAVVELHALLRFYHGDRNAAPCEKIGGSGPHGTAARDQYSFGVSCRHFEPRCPVLFVAEPARRSRTGSRPANSTLGPRRSSDAENTENPTISPSMGPTSGKF